MDVAAQAADSPSSQDRHSPAAAPRRLRLGTRLAISVALSVAAVVTLLTVAGLRVAEQLLRNDLVETARLTAVAVADDIEARDEPTISDTILPVLNDFMNAAIDISAISVFSVENGEPMLVVTTSTVAPFSTDLVRRAIAAEDEVTSQENADSAVVATPIRGAGRVTGAVTVAMSLHTIQQLRRGSTVVALGGIAAAIIGITFLIHVLARRLVLAPLDQIRRTIGRARRGDLAARATVTQDDELKEVADGLNTMLIELNDLHVSMSRRITEATSELRERNERLVRSYESVLQLRETAARAQQLATVGQTLANVAHQIGTPLNLVSGHVQLLQYEIDDPAVRRRLTIVQDQIGRVTSAVRDLLERARPRSESRIVDVSKMLERLVDAMRVRLATSGVAMDAHIPDSLPGIVADDTQLELALLNLMTNAVDAMPHGGTLTVAAERSAAGVRIAIRDTGPGIDPDVLPRIFEPWVTTKPAGHGSGLGLSITRDVVTQIGGTIEADSVPGRGVTFTVDLPEAPEVIG